MKNRLLPLPDTISSTSQHVACLVVTDLVSSTRLARRLPLPHYMALMTDLIQVLILHFEAYGGQVLQHQGDALVCMFTPAQVPQAVRATLEGHVRASQLTLAALLGERLELRAGLSVGEILTGPVGGMVSAYGLPVNLARRLCSASQPGETLICPSVVPHAQGLDSVDFVRQPVPTLPGFEDLTYAYRVSDDGVADGAAAPGSGRSHMKTG